MRIVITGGAGFLGSHLCSALLAREDDVVCVDNLSTGAIENIAELRQNPRFELVIADICSAIEVEGSIDAVLHFASPASPTDYLAQPLATLEVGSTGTRRALELAADHSARLVLASTSEIYGDPAEHPQSETYWGNVNPIGPRSVYDEAKRFAEALTMAWHRAKAADVGIVRIFNTYGPRLRRGDGRVISNFIAQAIEERPITVYGDGTQTRSFCYVDDMVRGILALLQSNLTGPVNMGNSDEISVLDLARAVIDLTGSSSEIVVSPLPIDDPTRRRPDITVARRDLGWEPTITLHEGLQRTIEYFKSASVHVEPETMSAPDHREFRASSAASISTRPPSS